MTTYVMPTNQPLSGPDGRPTPAAHRYLAGIEALSKRVTTLEGRVAADVTLSAGATVADLKSDIAAIKAALIAAGLMETA